MSTTTSHCPASKAAGLLGDKWVLLILRAMLMGATRYSDFTAAIPKISPSVLSGRLKQLAEDGLIVRKDSGGQQASYHLTPSGRETRPLIFFLAKWGLKWAERHTRDAEIDVGGAMWDFHRSMDTRELPDGETVFSVSLTDVGRHDKWWIIACGGEIDLCTEDPGKDVDLYMRGPLSAIVDVWMGQIPLSDALQEEGIQLTGESHLTRTAPRWFPLSPVVRAERAGATAQKGKPKP